MAKISITEKDLSWYTRQGGAGPLVVYVPGVSTNGPVDRPVICDSVPRFERVFGNCLSAPGMSRSFHIAESFIKAGASVLFHRFVGSTAACSSVVMDDSAFLTLRSKYPGEFLNGYSVTASTSKVAWSFEIKDLSGVTVERFVVNFSDPSSDRFYTYEVSNLVDVVVDSSVEDPSTIEVSTEVKKFESGTSGITSDSEVAKAISAPRALDCLKDPYLFDFDIATSAGFSLTMDVKSADPVDVAISNAVISRGTSIYLIDGISGCKSDEFYSYCEQFNTSYCSGIGPWCYAKLLDTGATALLPGSYVQVVSWAQSTSQGVPVWMAPAGVKRASLGSFFVKPQYEIGKSILDEWQNNDDSAVDNYKVNPIIRAKNYGYVIYGNSTLLHSSEEGETSMLQSLSTRMMSNVVKKEAFSIALGLQFDQMNSDLYVQFKTLMGAKLDEMKYQGAIYDYRIIVDTSSVTVGSLNEKTVPVTIQISPAPAVENFDITLELTRSGVTFTDDGTTVVDSED